MQVCQNRGCIRSELAEKLLTRVLLSTFKDWLLEGTADPDKAVAPGVISATKVKLLPSKYSKHAA